MKLKATPLEKLSPMLAGIEAISLEERKGRINKLQSLMRQQDLAAVVLDASTSLYYFTGIAWSQSERITAAVIPCEGEVAYVCPAFESDRLKEMILFGKDVYTWEEDESPFERIVTLLRDRGKAEGRIGIDDKARFFLFDGIRATAAGCEYVNAEQVISACRMIKSKAEIALLQRANDITAEAFKTCISRLREGMSQSEFYELSVAAHKAMGVQGGIGVQFGAATAFPHGSKEPSYLKKGDVVLMDGGCRVEGYTSDISRTIVFGDPTVRQKEIWDLEKRAQAAGFAAARLGATCGDVDAAARRVIEQFGFGPGYKVPGLPHRTGHGIGLDGHEWGNILPGSQTELVPGMCFSVEPNISIYGEFGIRLEDCVYMDENGAHYFTEPSPSIDEPFKT
ncbi:MAG: M24 family metallopeptidase [Spirochaetia bacterium]